MWFYMGAKLGSNIWRELGQRVFGNRLLRRLFGWYKD
jgi:hypothetical protein